MQNGIFHWRSSNIISVHCSGGNLKVLTLYSFEQLFSPTQNSYEIFLLIWNEKTNFIASHGCVWLSGIRGTGKSRCKMSLLQDTLIPFSRNHGVICHVVQPVFLFNTHGKLNHELLDSSLSPFAHTKSTIESDTAQQFFLERLHKKITCCNQILGALKDVFWEPTYHLYLPRIWFRSVLFIFLHFHEGIKERIFSVYIYIYFFKSTFWIHDHISLLKRVSMKVLHLALTSCACMLQVYFYRTSVLYEQGCNFRLTSEFLCTSGLFPFKQDM